MAKYAYNRGMSEPSDPDDNEARRVVQRMGGPSKAAAFFGISQPAVSQWVVSGQIPAARRLHLMHLHPEWFEDGAGASSGAAVQAQEAA